MRKSRPALCLLLFTTGLMDVFPVRTVRVFSLQKVGGGSQLERPEGVL